MEIKVFVSSRMTEECKNEREIAELKNPSKLQTQSKQRLSTAP